MDRYQRPKTQPPSGGCVLKPLYRPPRGIHTPSAAFRRLCVETTRYTRNRIFKLQPPSGGCVLKHKDWAKITPNLSAAFRRLCVETFLTFFARSETTQPPSGGCVLKQRFGPVMGSRIRQPPSGGCVLKLTENRKCAVKRVSRLQAAVC